MKDIQKTPLSDFRNSHLDQLVHVEPKVWGHEEWIVNNPKYCGKKLVLKRGFGCSLHYHKIKEETFYVLAGKVLLQTVEKGERKNRIMTPGEVSHIKVGLQHRFIGIQDSIIIEFSTFHRENDSYRLESSGKFDLRLFGF